MRAVTSVVFLDLKEASALEMKFATHMEIVIEVEKSTSESVENMPKNATFRGLGNIVRFSRFFDFVAENIKNYVFSDQTAENPSAEHTFLSIP